MQKGVSLIITFFIMVILLLAVLSISLILYGQIKIVRNIGNSVISFYAADGGVEKVLYYDRKNLIAGQNRGSCSACDLCGAGDYNSTDPYDQQMLECIDCTLTGTDCDDKTCSDCQLTFSTVMGAEKTYNIDFHVLQACKSSGGVLKTIGYYYDSSRAIQLDMSSKVPTGIVPEIGGQVCTPIPTGQGVSGYVFEADIIDGGNLEVFALVNGLGDENENQCKAYNNYTWLNNQCIYREIEMKPSFTGSSHYTSGPWNFNIEGVEYVVYIMATDDEGNCVQVPACIINEAG